MDGTKLSLLEWRKSLLAEKGGLQKPDVTNKEWLYLLETETRNSIMIEGYFTKESELKRVIHNNDTTIEHADKVLSYYSTASMLYEFAFQKYLSKEPFELKTFDVNTIHSLLFKGVDSRIAGKLRTGDIIISGATIKPITGSLTSQAMDYFLACSKYVTKEYDIVSMIAIIHVLFESLHLYEDGNGRTGRILINYILLWHGLPNIIIKGTDIEKQKYITSLEAGEKGLYEFFPNNVPDHSWIGEGNFEKLTGLILTGLYTSLDRMILQDEDEHSLRPLTEIAEELGHSNEYARKLAQRGKVIAKKIKGQWYSDVKYFHLKT